MFALSYGENVLSLNGRFPGLGDIRDSARELSRFVDTVRFFTGASKVDNFVGLAPSNHGTTLSGLTEIGEALNLLGLANTFLGLFAPALVQQEIGSDFQRGLFGDGDTVAGPDYTVITTTKDIVVTPHTQGYLTGPKVENITIQNQCPDDPVGHIGLSYDSPTIQNVLNELGPNVPDFRPVCRDYGIGI